MRFEVLNSWHAWLYLKAGKFACIPIVRAEGGVQADRYCSIAVMSPASIQDTIRLILAAESPKPVCAYLFGSRGREDSCPDSDADIAVLYAIDPPHTLAGMGFELQSSLEHGISLPVDLIVLNHARPELIHSVLRDGQLLYDDEPSLRVAFEVKARREYFDVLPYLQEYRGLTGKRSA